MVKRQADARLAEEYDHVQKSVLCDTCDRCGIVIGSAGSRDPLIAPAWAEQAHQRLQRAYVALGAPDQLYVDRFDGVHQWHGDVAYQVLDRVLGR